MDLLEITINIWVLPHRAYGYVKSIDTSWVDDFPAQGLYQSFKDSSESPDKTEVDHKYAYKEITVSEEQLKKLVELVDSASYRFIEHPASNAFGRNSYGLRIERGSHKITVEWNGFEFQDETLCEIWSMVDEFVNV